MDGGRTQRVLYVDCAPFTGGAQRSLLSLVEGVRGRGWEPEVLTADASPYGVAAACRRLGVPVRELHTRHWRRSPLGAFQFACDRWLAGRRIAAAIQAAPPTLVHANTVRAALLLPSQAWSRLPVVVHDRDLRVPALAVRYLGRRGGRIIAISRCVAGKWRGVTDRVVVIPNGFDIDSLRAARPAVLPGKPAGVPAMVLVADLEPWKNHGCAIAAAAKLRQDGTPVHLVIVGRPRSRHGQRLLADLMALAAQLGVSEAVSFVTDAADALPYLAAASVAVSTATAEPFGRTVVEALALGKPVVAVRGGGPEEVLTGCPVGTLAEDAPAALAAAVQPWVATRDDVSAAALQWARRYSLDAALDRLCTVYQECLGMA